MAFKWNPDDLAPRARHTYFKIGYYKKKFLK